MKKLLALLLSMSMLIMCAPGISLVASAADPVPLGGGDGSTAKKAYQISTPEQFVDVFCAGGAQTALARDKNKYFKQTADITINVPYTPQSDGNVVCKYDGAGFSITINNYVPAAGSSINEGLFATVGSGGKISNLTVKGTIDATGEGKVGGIAGQLSSGTISNCTNEATIKGSSNVGGIAGQFYVGTIEFCVNEGTISNTGGALGGIVGCGYGKSSSNATISNCANYGTLTNDSSEERIPIGGLVGSAGINLIVEKSFNAGAINVVNGSAGALIGSNYSAGNFNVQIEDCFNTGVITTSKPEGNALVIGNYTTLSSDKSLQGLSVKNIYDISNPTLPVVHSGMLTALSNASVTPSIDNASIFILGGAVTKDTINNAFTSAIYEKTQGDGYDYPNFVVDGTDIKVNYIPVVEPTVTTGNSVFLSSDAVSGDANDIETAYAIVCGKISGLGTLDGVEYGAFISKAYSGNALTEATATAKACGEKYVTAEGVSSYGILIYGENMVAGDTYYVRPFVKYADKYYYGTGTEFVFPGLTE